MPDQFVYETIRDWIEQCPDGAARRDVCEAFGITRNTAIYHLEKLVKRGELVKTYTWTTGHARGWVYYSPKKAPVAGI
jgi:predicted ArsR family transcriptional regulator